MSSEHLGEQIALAMAANYDEVALAKQDVASVAEEECQLFVARILNDLVVGLCPELAPQNSGDSALGEQLRKLVENEASALFLQTLTGKQMRPRRIQVNDYHTGGFVDWHIDSDSCPCYQAAIVLQIGEDYEGGEMMVETPQHEERVVRLGHGEVLVSHGLT